MTDEITPAEEAKAYAAANGFVIVREAGKLRIGTDFSAEPLATLSGYPAAFNWMRKVVQERNTAGMLATTQKLYEGVAKGVVAANKAIEDWREDAHKKLQIRRAGVPVEMAAPYKSYEEAALVSGTAVENLRAKAIKTGRERSIKWTHPLQKGPWALLYRGVAHPVERCASFKDLITLVRREYAGRTDVTYAYLP